MAGAVYASHVVSAGSSAPHCGSALGGMGPVLQTRTLRCRRVSSCSSTQSWGGEKLGSTQACLILKVFTLSLYCLRKNERVTAGIQGSKAALL